MLYNPIASRDFQNTVMNFLLNIFRVIKLDDYSIAGINITQDVRVTAEPLECCSGSCPGSIKIKDH